jgi:flavin-dependent dehydrogenase
VAATVLARAGARVRLLDRATFPRDKLCGDTVNPGTLTLLRRLGMSDCIEGHGLVVDGMTLTGEHGISIAGRYPRGLIGRALVRRDVDWSLLVRAMAAGAEFEPGVAVRRPIIEPRARGFAVSGVVAGRDGHSSELRARVTIAADGRRSTLSFGLGLARHPRTPRRWAVGAYFSDVAGLTTFGEMHVRRDRYIGVAAVPGGVTNVCLVKPSQPADPDLVDAESLLMREVGRDPELRDRFAQARLVRPPVVLGPLAVDAKPVAIDGLLVAGDAAGFVDPITGDGLRFAVRGGELAAMAALEALEHGWSGVHVRLTARRRREFASKCRFNRAIRALVSSPRAIGAATFAARFTPAMFEAIIRKAGDCDLCSR